MSNPPPSPFPSPPPPASQTTRTREGQRGCSTPFVVGGTGIAHQRWERRGFGGCPSCRPLLASHSRNSFRGCQPNGFAGRGTPAQPGPTPRAQGVLVGGGGSQSPPPHSSSPRPWGQSDGEGSAGEPPHHQAPAGGGTGRATGATGEGRHAPHRWDRDPCSGAPGEAGRWSWHMRGPTKRLPDPGRPVLPSRRDTKGWAAGRAGDSNASP